MRTLPLVLFLALACGGETTSPSQASTVIFRLDSQSCASAGALTLNFFLDGQAIGAGTIAIGTDKSFPNQPAGSHTLAASETRAGGHVWPAVTAVIPLNGSYAQVLSCL